MPRRTALALLIALAPAPALAQSGPSLLDLLAPDRILQRVLQSGVMALRTQLDIKYGDMFVDLASGRVTMTDLRVWPLPEWDTKGDCEITVDRVVVGTSAPLDRIDVIGLRVQMIGAEAPAVCLPPEPRGMLAMAGLDRIAVPRLTLDAEYRVGSSEARLHAFGDVSGAAAVDLTANFAYLWVDGRDDMEEPKPVAYLDAATLRIENKGAWQALRGQLPPQYTDPAGAAMVVQGTIGSAIAQMNREAADPDAEGDPSALTDAQRAFLNSAMEVWPAFLENPETLVLETGIEGDVYLDLEAMEDDPRLLFATLKPRVALAPARQGELLPAALLSQALGVEASALSPEDRRRIGIALVTGEGAPRNLEAGFGLLNSMARDGDGVAALAMSEALETRMPEDAYRWALLAGAAGETGATSRLDRIEGRLPLARILALQNDVSGNATHSGEALTDIAAIRAQAAMRLSGEGLARSYQHAAMWAMIGKAAGDAEAADILAEIDERVRLAGPGAREAWSAAEAAASRLATEAWIGQDLPARFGG